MRVEKMNAQHAGDCVLIPVKGLRDGKSRLSAHLPDAVRHSLNRMQLAETLSAVVQVFGARNCMVISACPEVRRLADAENVVYVEEPAPRGLNNALAYAKNLLQTAGARMITVVPVDLMHISRATLHDVLRRHPATESFIVPDTELAGTNVFHFPASLPFEFRYGADSFRDHVRALIRCGVSPHVYANTSLADDLDAVSQFMSVPRYRRLMEEGRQLIVQA
jgi:2-phospho-L-lactate guanylyltransferase